VARKQHVNVAGLAGSYSSGASRVCLLGGQIGTKKTRSVFGTDYYPGNPLASVLWSRSRGKTAKRGFAHIKEDPTKTFSGGEGPGRIQKREVFLFSLSPGR